MPHYPQIAMVFAQDEINPSSQWHQMGEFVQPQMISPQLLQLEQDHDVYLQTPRGELGDHGGQLAHQWMGMPVDAADCMADPFNLDSEAMDVSEMCKYVNPDGYGVQYDGAS
jgi:hypothetical protein